MPNSWIKHPLAGLFLLLGGCAMAAGAAWIGIDSYRFVRAAESTPGKVVALHRTRGARGSENDHPVVEYRDPETGSLERFESSFGIRPSPFAVDDVVVVAIRRDPPRVEIDSFCSLWLLPLLLAAFGLACVIAGRSIRVAARSRRS